MKVHFQYKGAYTMVCHTDRIKPSSKGSRTSSDVRNVTCKRCRQIAQLDSAEAIAHRAKNGASFVGEAPLTSAE